MKGNSLIEISLKHLKRKENIIFVIIITLLIIILFVLMTIINFSINYKKENNKYNINARTLMVIGYNKTEKELDAISNIPHVVVNVDDFYRYPYHQDVKEFDNDNLKGHLAVKSLVIKDGKKIIDGRNIKNDNEMLIPTEFYPHNEFNDYENKIYLDKMIKGKELIGKKIVLYSEKNYPFRPASMNEDEYNKLWEEWKANRKAITFTIVGTYDTTEQLEEKNTVYVSMKALDEIKNEMSGKTTVNEADGSVNYFSTRMIIVDNYKNIEFVREKLNQLQIDNRLVLEYDDGVLMLITYLPLFVSVIIVIMTLILIKKFISKKFKNIHYELGLYQALGFNNNQIVLVELYENLFIAIISVIGALLVFVFLFIILTKKLSFFTLAIYYSITFKIPYLYFTILSIILLLYILFLNKSLISNHLKCNASELLKED